METSLWVASYVAMMVAVALPLLASSKQMQAAQEKSRERRLKDAQMNARLLRLNL